MQFSTTPEIPCKTIQENLGIVTGNVVQSKHVGRDLMAGLKGIIGGEIVGYTEMLADARHRHRKNGRRSKRTRSRCDYKHTFYDQRHYG